MPVYCNRDEQAKQMAFPDLPPYRLSPTMCMILRFHSNTTLLSVVAVTVAGMQEDAHSIAQMYLHRSLK